MNRLLLGALIAQTLMEQVRKGRWQTLPDGRLVPVDTTPLLVLLWEAENKERINAQAQDTSSNT